MMGENNGSDPWHGATVMLRFPGDAPMVFIVGQWQRCGDVIFATFTREQLELCMKLAQPQTFAERKAAALRLAAKGGNHV